MTVPNSQMISRGLRVQSAVSVLLAACLLLLGPVAAYSSLFGSLAAYIPALLFALIVVPKLGQDSGTFLRAAMIAEFAKLIMTALICMVVFIWVKPLAAGWFFAGMMAVIFSGRLALLAKNQSIEPEHKTKT